MAKKKADLLEEAKAAGLEVTEKNTVAEIQAALDGAATQEAPAEEQPSPAEESADEAKTEEAPAEEESFAKAGKRSKKAVEEAEAEAAKEERKAKIASGEIEEAPTKRGPVPITRSRLERRGKAYRKSAESIDRSKTYPLAEAVELAKNSSTVKFDASVELHMRLGVDPKHADQNIRGSLVMPHGTGKSQRVAVFAPADMHADAKAAGADIVGEDDFLAQLDKEVIDFDVLIATPEGMPKLGKYARSLGPKGLMPNPKSGTVTKDVKKAVSEAKAGRVEYRVDKQGIIHQAIGKVSFEPKQLVENAQAIIESINQARPTSIKGDYVLSVYLTTSMGPSVKVNL